MITAMGTIMTTPTERLELQMQTFGAPEQVYVENGWWDGPRAGIADIDGIPHRFLSLIDDAQDQFIDTFMVCPLARSVLDLAVEQWRIFIEWNARFESNQAEDRSRPMPGRLVRNCAVSTGRTAMLRRGPTISYPG
ncbi:hypothetical protein LQ564_01535 [Massilia sp. G4R7]|uniref:Uncharacterized protein n=1 Tax=Massilia phyllostachyos TaxID=2898585 RepID=A0ABS8PZQ7_9BURK|nr:hypothetical protein [Massilia phyllostachyos]MCD2514992.1 hypothetical protein [Massilia phyllostachyos]